MRIWVVNFYKLCFVAAEIKPDRKWNNIPGDNVCINLVEQIQLRIVLEMLKIR